MIGLTVYIMRKEKKTNLVQGMSLEEQTEIKENATGIAQWRNDETWRRGEVARSARSF